MANKKMIVYKHNPVIRGHFTKDDNVLTVLNEFDFDVLNSVYKITQDRYKGILPDVYSLLELKRFSCVELKKILNINSKRYVELIKESLQNIFDVSIVLKNYIDPVHGNKIENYQTRILGELGFNKEEDINIIYLSFTAPLMTSILRRKSNYTAVDLKKTREIKSKYGKRLYEHLLSLKGFRNEFTLRVDDLNKLFGFEETSIRRFNQILSRCYESVNNKISFSYESHTRDKCISFIIS